MSNDIIRIVSISQLFKIIGAEEPKHPLIGLLDLKTFQFSDELINQKMTSDFYTVILKDGDCGMDYGRNKYDFEEGVLRFLGPNQVVSSTKQAENTYGFMLFFHPDLIRNFPLGKEIERYTYFSYEVNEALHLSKKEEGILLECVAHIKDELEENIDKHSQELLVTNLQLLLNYSKRFYERQFITRSASNSDVVTRAEREIKDYYEKGRQLEDGSLTVHLMAENLNLSSNYLSDLLRKEIGKSAKELIDDHIVNLSKNALINSEQSVSEIAYDLGFNYPHYFSRLFKKKTGETPNEFRAKMYN